MGLPRHRPGSRAARRLAATGAALVLAVAVAASAPPATAATGAGTPASVGSAEVAGDTPWGDPSAVSPRPVWAWPSGGPVPVPRAFDPPPRPWLAGHRGVDLDVPVGSPVRAPESGTVVFAGTVVDRGVVTIDHGGLRSSFEPVRPLVRVGQRVARGEVVATVAEGHSPGALHWGVRTGPRAYVDPLRLLTGRVVLKPWSG